jgi:hypothetical protein
MRIFYNSHSVAALCLIGTLFIYGSDAAFLVVVLAVLEISLSMDNAVVNASVLKTMTPLWQKRFMTWGILIAVFGMRLVFPVLIVAFAANINASDVMSMALTSPDDYSRHLHAAHPLIASFGGIFLLMVALSFLLDDARDVYWIGYVEKRLQTLGKIDAVNTTLSLTVLMAISALVPESIHSSVLIGGIWGLFLYGLVSSLDSLFSVSDDQSSITQAAQRGGLMAFLYLEILDASFSFDGVIGAFAITQDVPIIMLGLGIGAWYVRSLTVYLVNKGTLDQYIYLEHGAHYAILTLAVLMLASTLREIPETVTGLTGATLIGVSLSSSIRHNKHQAALANS